VDHEQQLMALFDQAREENGLGLSSNQLVGLLRDRALLADTMVQRVSEITADVATKHVYECALGVAQVKAAFTQSLPRDDTDEVLTSVRSLAECLGRCGGMKYMLVDPMPLGLKAAGFIKNALGELSVEQLVTESTIVRAPPRFQPETANRLVGESVASFQSVVRCWYGMRLNGLPGWPRWEHDVYQLLHPQFRTMCEAFLDIADPAELDSQPPRLPLTGWLRFCHQQKLILDDYSEEAASITFEAAIHGAAVEAADVKAVEHVVSPPAKVKHRMQMARESGRKHEPPTLDRLPGATLPEFLSAFVAASFWSVNPLWRPGSADVVSVPDALRPALAEQAVHHTCTEHRQHGTMPTGGEGTGSEGGGGGPSPLTPRIVAALVHLPDVTAEGALAEPEVVEEEQTMVEEEEEVGGPTVPGLASKLNSKNTAAKKRGAKGRPKMKQSEYEALMADLTAHANDYSAEEMDHLEELKKRLAALRPGHEPSPRRASPRRAKASPSQSPRRVKKDSRPSPRRVKKDGDDVKPRVSFSAGGADSEGGGSTPRRRGAKSRRKKNKVDEDDESGDAATGDEAPAEESTDVEGWGADVEGWVGAGGGASSLGDCAKTEGDMAAARANVAARIAATLAMYEGEADEGAEVDEDAEDEDEFAARGRKAKALKKRTVKGRAGSASAPGGKRSPRRVSGQSPRSGKQSPRRAPPSTFDSTRDGGGVRKKEGKPAAGGKKSQAKTILRAAIKLQSLARGKRARDRVADVHDYLSMVDDIKKAVAKGSKARKPSPKGSPLASPKGGAPSPTPPGRRERKA